MKASATGLAGAVVEVVEVAFGVFEFPVGFVSEFPCAIVSEFSFDFGVAAWVATLPFPATENDTSGPPTAICRPGSPCRATTVPATGDVSSTVALSVMTSAMIWSSATVSPTLTCQPTSSASAVPSPTSGSLKT